MKLRMARPKLTPVSARLVSLSDPKEWDRNRIHSEPWRAWYRTVRWKKLRWSVLVRDLFTCKYCNRLFSDTSELVADHIIPHRGDEQLFWDSKNLQTLCKQHHDSIKKSEELKERNKGWSR